LLQGFRTAVVFQLAPDSILDFGFQHGRETVLALLIGCVHLILGNREALHIDLEEAVGVQAFDSRRLPQQQVVDQMVEHRPLDLLQLLVHLVDFVLNGLLKLPCRDRFPVDVGGDSVGTQSVPRFSPHHRHD